LIHLRTVPGSTPKWATCAIDTCLVGVRCWIDQSLPRHCCRLASIAGGYSTWCGGTFHRNPILSDRSKRSTRFFRQQRSPTKSPARFTASLLGVTGNCGSNFRSLAPRIFGKEALGGFDRHRRHSGILAREPGRCVRRARRSLHRMHPLRSGRVDHQHWRVPDGRRRPSSRRRSLFASRTKLPKG